MKENDGLPVSLEVAREHLRRSEQEGLDARLKNVWPCDHPVTPKQRSQALASAKRHQAGTREHSSQYLTAYAYNLGLAGGIYCPVCWDLLATIMRRMKA